MDYEECVDLYDRIVNGVSLVEVEGKLYFVKDITPKIRQIIKRKYESAYAYFIDNGLLNKNQISDLLKEYGVWSQANEDYLSELNDAIGKLREEIPKLEFRSMEKARIVNQIQRYETEKRDLEASKNSLMTASAEYQATLDMYREALFHLTFDELGNKVFTNYSIFSSLDEKFINKLLNNSFLDTSLDNKSIRELARSEPWRSVWISSVKTGNLFPHAKSQMTELQRILVSWSIMYDGVYESMDCPSEDVIKNDELLDAWFDQQSAKRKEKLSSNAASNIVKGNVGQEIGIIVDNLEDAKKVYELNDPASKRVLRSRSKAINAQGSMSEGHLPDVKQDIQMRKTQMQIEGIKQRAR